MCDTTWANHSWGQPQIWFGQMEDRHESVMTAGITSTTASFHLPCPFTPSAPSLSPTLNTSFYPSVHSLCPFPVLSPPVSLHRTPRLLRRLPSRWQDLNIDDDKCPNLSRAISISGAEGEGVGWAPRRVCQHHIPLHSFQLQCLSFVWCSV